MGLALLVPSTVTVPSTSFTDASAAERPETNDEYTLKAAFLHKFACHVKWPEGSRHSDEAELVVAVVGKNPFGRKLEDSLEGRRVGARRVSVKFFKNVRALEACHLLYVPAAEERNLASIREAWAGQSVLIVAESIAAAQGGAHIGFYMDKSKVRFAINETDARADRIEVSSELLKLAKIVKPVHGAGE